jgi:hypothetical protein
MNEQNYSTASSVTRLRVDMPSAQLIKHLVTHGVWGSGGNVPVSIVDGDKWLPACLNRFVLRKETLVCVEQEAGRASELVRLQ